MIRPFKRYI